MILKNICLFISILSISLFAQGNELPEKTSLFHVAGRVEILKEGNVVLIGSASSVTFEFTNANCEVILQSTDSDHHNYVVFELDGDYLGRFRIKKGAAQSFPIKTTKKQSTHRLTIYKATEAANGSVLFLGTNASLQKFELKKKKKVEFIGDSITCGFGNDVDPIPCGSGDWYDQHNGYMAYGPQLARTLDFDYVLSSVSGYGMYRNWNDEHQDEPIIPDVYENLYLNKDASKPYDFAFQPTLVSICLGTNDLSDGDGAKPRLPFNEEKYVLNYIEFIKTVYKHAPNTRILLLSSPMVSGERNVIFISSLKKVMKAFENDKAHQPINLFEFQPMTPNGCGTHPDIADDKIMADELIPVFKKLLHEK